VLGFLSLQEPFEPSSFFVVSRIQADDAGFEVDVPPLDLQHLARDVLAASVTARIAVYGPVRTVVWQGSAGDRRPYADQRALCCLGDRANERLCAVVMSGRSGVRARQEIAPYVTAAQSSRSGTGPSRCRSARRAWLGRPTGPARLSASCSCANVPAAMANAGVTASCATFMSPSQHPHGTSNTPRFTASHVSSTRCDRGASPSSSRQA
jgi:hypothetical protein